jgi:hypothetical protein
MSLPAGKTGIIYVLMNDAMPGYACRSIVL